MEGIEMATWSGQQKDFLPAYRLRNGCFASLPRAANNIMFKMRIAGSQRFRRSQRQVVVYSTIPTRRPTTTKTRLHVRGGREKKGQANQPSLIRSDWSGRRDLRLATSSGFCLWESEREVR